MSLFSEARSRVRRGLSLALSFLLMLSMALVISFTGAQPASAVTTDCDFADPDSGTYASTLCWIDFSDYDQSEAQTGQPYEVNIPGGYVLSFILQSPPLDNYGGLTPDTFPTYANAFLGNNGFYSGVDGQPALYQTDVATTTTVGMTNIRLTNAAGEAVHGFAIVGADAESTDEGESIEWRAQNSGITSLTQTETEDGLGNACSGGFDGIGTKQVVCSGGPEGIKTGTAIVAADDPGGFAQILTGGGRQAAAFGVLLSKVELTKQVENGFAGDSFDISVTDGDQTLATASTGPDGDTATTGPATAVLGAGGSEVTFSEEADPGVLGLYDSDWACTRSGEPDATLPSGGAVGSSADVHLGIGGDVSCTITNTGLQRSISMVKQTEEPLDVNEDGLVDAGDEIDYTFDVTNTGSTDLADIAIDDDTVGSVSCPDDGPLAPGETITCTTGAPYTITEADEEAGAVHNTATATGTVPGTSTDVTSEPSETNTPVATPAPDLLLTKTGDPSEPSDYQAGQEITYTFVATNVGNVPLGDVEIEDTEFSGSGELSGLTCGEDRDLAPGEQLQCTATYVLTQADVNAEEVTNVANSHGTDPDGAQVDSPPAEALTPAQAAPAIALIKAVDPETVPHPGETVEYTFDVLNSGNVTLSDPSITETEFTGTGDPLEIDCPTAAFDPGQIISCTATYTVTPADADAGQVDNTATASAAAVAGDAPTSDPASATFTVPPSPGITVDKVADPEEINTVGTDIDYSFVVSNTGNVTLTDVEVADLAFSGSGELGEINCPEASLAAAEEMTCSSAYEATQADVDAGEITNQAQASGQSPDDETAPVTSPIDDAKVTVDREPGIDLNKSATPQTYGSVGEVITYTFTITNTGNVSVADPEVNDTEFTGSGGASTVSCPVGVIAPGDAIECTSDYRVTQEDIDRGTIDNTATATADPPHGTDPPTSAPSSETVTADRAPVLTLEKSVDPTTVEQAGDMVSYTFVVVNTGNTTLDDISISETEFSGSGTLDVNCPPGSLAPEEETTCTADYPLTQQDVDQGEVSNTAVAEGTPVGSDEPVPSDPSDADVTVAGNPRLELAKNAKPADQLTAGETIDYTFTVTNTGNQTMTDVTVLEDEFSGSAPTSDIRCPDGASSLAPGTQVVCTASYTVTQADVDHGTLSNTAHAAGTPPGGDEPVPSDPDTVQVPQDPKPSISLQKSNDAGGTYQVGQQITYDFVVTNTGNVTLADVAVQEGDFDGSGELSDVSCPDEALAPARQVTCTATYLVTQADVDQGEINNGATARGTPPGGSTPITSPPDHTTVKTDAEPTLTLEKITDTDELSVGETISYSYLVTNTGNVTVHDVTVSEDEFNGSGDVVEPSCPEGAASLAPGEQVICTTSYTVTQGDVDRGDLTNTASAHGTPPDGPTVDSPPDTVELPQDPTPALTVQKTAEPASVTAVGDQVDYTFAITNTGSVTLKDVDVTEESFTGSGKVSEINCPGQAGSLAPGDQVTCTATYEATQKDLDAGAISNTATAHGTPPGGEKPVPSDPSEATVLAEGASSLQLKKVVEPDVFDAAGDKINYRFRITNTGTVTVSNPSVSEQLFTGTGKLKSPTCPEADLAPGESVTCTVGYQTTAEDLQRGQVDNTAFATATPPGTTDPVVSQGDSAQLVGSPDDDEPGDEPTDKPTDEPSEEPTDAPTGAPTDPSPGDEPSDHQSGNLPGTGAQFSAEFVTFGALAALLGATLLIVAWRRSHH